MIELATIEMKRPRNTRTVLYQRAEEKLRGVIFTLQRYMRYLDHKSMGNVKASNNELDQILKNNSGFPVLSKDEIDAKRLLEPVAKSLPEEFGRVLKEAQFGEEPSEVISILSEKLGNAEFTASGNDRKACEWALERLKEVQDGYSALAEEDLAKAQKIHESFKYGRRFSGHVSLVKDFEEALGVAINAKEIELIIGEPLPKGKSSESALEEYMKSLRDAQKFEELLKVLKVKNPSPSYRNTQSPVRALRHFLAGQRFELAKDYVSAYAEYRSVVGFSTNDLIPHAEAIAAMNRLREENPDLISKFDDNGLLQEIQGQIQRLELNLRSLRSRERHNSMRQ